MLVCEDELEKQQAMDEAKLKGDHGINHAVSDDINTMFEGKTSSELQDLESQINGHISNGEAADVEYWENLLKRLLVHKAKATLREVQASLLQQRLRKLTDNGESNFDAEGGARIPDEKEEQEAAAKAAMPPPPAFLGGGAYEDSEDEDGGWSPVYMTSVDEDDEDFVVDAEEDLEEITRLRRAVGGIQAGLDAGGMGIAAAGATADEDALFSKELARGLEDQEAGEVAFSEEADTGGSEQYTWHDKYKPRKPRYFNRVHTGYEWNKYNQTHYDHDNPPPKVVQGYKFNVFYPDLIDKAKAPTFHINPDPDGNPELAVIRFSAGPPYEDIAFKVVNREWEYSHKKGYKCTFDRGILHLFFNFKRHRYRR